MKVHRGVNTDNCWQVIMLLQKTWQFFPSPPLYHSVSHKLLPNSQRELLIPKVVGMGYKKMIAVINNIQYKNMNIKRTTLMTATGH